MLFDLSDHALNFAIPPWRWNLRDMHPPCTLLLGTTTFLVISTIAMMHSALEHWKLSKQEPGYKCNENPYPERKLKRHINLSIKILSSSQINNFLCIFNCKTMKIQEQNILKRILMILQLVSQLIKINHIFLYTVIRPFGMRNLRHSTHWHLFTGKSHL